MQNRKFLLLVQKLSDTDFDQFAKYVASPYFNSNKRAIQFIQLLKKYHPNYNVAALNQKKVFTKVFGNKPFREQALKNLLTELTKLFYQFLAQQNFHQDSLYQEQALINSLISKHDFESVEKKMTQTNQSRAKYHPKGIDYYYHQWRLTETDHSLSVGLKSRLKNTNLEEVLFYLDTFYIAQTLRYYCIISNRRTMTQQKINMPLLEQILIYLNTQEQDKLPDVIVLWYKLSLLLREENKAPHYFDLKNLLSQHKGKNLPKEELRSIYIAMLNYCNRCIRMGKSDYYQEFFDCYQLMFAQDIIIKNGYITPTDHFSNIISSAIKVNKIVWAENFIEEHKEKIRPEQRDSVVSYTRALIALEKKEFWESVSHLQSLDLKDSSYYSSHKILMSKAYFELEEFELLESLTNAFSTYIRRNEKMSDPIKETYLNFIKIMNKLARLKQDKIALPKEKYASLQAAIAEELNEMKRITQKGWLLGKTQ